MNARSTFSRWLWFGGIAIALLTLIAHVRGLEGQFVDWDDTTHVTQNAAIRALAPDNLWTMFTEPIAKLYIPLTWLSFAIDYQVWGRDPFGYHLTNLLLHIANTLLVLVLAYRLLRDRFQNAASAALLTAAIFGVHPLRVESVAWVTERKDVLFAFFLLLALLAHLRWVTSGKRSAYWCGFAFFIASVLSKSAAVTFPVVLLLLDAFWARRSAFREKVPFFAVSIIVGLATVVAQAGGSGETMATTEVIPLWARLGLVGFCAIFYVQKFFWPFHLSAIYPVFDEMEWNAAIAFGYVAAFVAATALVIVLRRRAPALLPSWLFYLITLSPTIGLVPVGIHVVADRFSYVPLLGLALPVSMGIVLAFRPLKPRILVIPASGVLAAILLTMTILSASRTSVWKNTETLFISALAENPRCLPAHVNLTVWYTRQKRHDEAIAHGRQAVEIAPNGLHGRKNLAFALINAGRHREAIAVLRVPVDNGVEDPDIWRGLAECFEAEGDLQNAKAARDRMDRSKGSR